MKKIKATISKPTISTLKFQRKSDFNKLLKFIEKETKELKNIKIPKRSEIKSKKKGVNLFGLGLLGLFGLLGAGFGGGEDEKEVKEEQFGIDKFMIGRVQEDKKGDNSLTKLKDFGATTKISTAGGIKVPLFKNIFGKSVNAATFDEVAKENKVKVQREQQAESRRSNTTEAEIGGDKTQKSKSSTATIDKNQGKQGPTGGTRNRIRGGNQNQMPEGYSPLSETDKMADRAQQYKQTLDDIEKVEKQLERARMPKTKERLTERLNVLRKRLEDLSPKSTVKPNILQRFMNFYNQGRTPAEDTMPFFGKKGLIADDFSKITRTDKAYKDGATGLKGARPFKAFTPRMLKTGPTPLTRQLIERPFRSLFGTGSNMLKSVRKDYAKALFKSKTKSGLFFVDVFFAGQSFYDLFARPGDNILVTIRDFSTAVNNAVNRNDPEKLRYFVRRSRKSSPLFGVSNDAIRQFEINRNLEIKKLKEEAAAAKTSVIREESSNRNVIITPQNNNAKRGSGVRNRTTGGKKISFLPMDLKNPFADQIEYKLSK